MNQNENWILKVLSLPVDVKITAVLKSLPKAHAKLSELKGTEKLH